MSAQEPAAELRRINEQLQQEIEELRQQLEEAQTIFDALPVMFWYKDTENRHIRINRAAAELEGVPVTAIEGKTAEELYPPEQAAAYHKDDLEVIRSGKPKLGIIEKHSRAMGEVMWLETGKVPFRNREGQIVGVIVFAIDITEQKRAQESLQATLEHVTQALERGADRDEVLEYLRSVRAKFEESE